MKKQRKSRRVQRRTPVACSACPWEFHDPDLPCCKSCRHYKAKVRAITQNIPICRNAAPENFQTWCPVCGKYHVSPHIMVMGPNRRGMCEITEDSQASNAGGERPMKPQEGRSK